MSDPKQTTVDCQSYRYWAFISYSNKDKKWARWLHRSIETYGIPTQLVSHPTPIGEPAPKRFHPLFHDRSELPASSDLGSQIESALRDSRYLIVVCSPRSAQSKWVNKEIETFQRLHRKNRIFAIIVEGEPNVGGEQECFPPALLASEPIAADARPDTDGKNNAKIKLLAGMLGVTFDALKQREAHRQIRRLQRIIVVSLLLVLGFAGLAWFANYQREKAVYARQEAELVLSFLVYDLSEDLESIGRLDISSKVKQRVDDYYRRLGTEPSMPDTLRNRGVAFLNEGDILSAQGNLQSALSSYRKALAIGNQLVAADLQNPELKRESQRDVARALIKMGDLNVSLGNSQVAFTDYTNCISIRQTLAQIEPDDADVLEDLSQVQERLGDLLVLRGDLMGALKAHRSSLAIRERVVARYPKDLLWQRQIIISELAIGDILFDQGDLENTETSYRRCLKFAESLAETDPENRKWQYDLSISHERLARCYEKKNDFNHALAEFNESLQIDLKLVADDPENTVRQRNLHVAYSHVGDALLAQNRFGEATKAYREGLAISKKLTALNPTNKDWQKGLSVSYVDLGKALLAQDDFSGAIKSFQEALAIDQRLTASDPTNADWQRSVGICYWNIAQTSELAKMNDASQWWMRAYDQFSNMKKIGTMIPADEAYWEQLRQKVGR